ncbi:uncharacterized protein LOC115988290 [Quercus lobata]|uniref:uncharacterized protein LOC115988290 n=1 Tax=Quercus lobata TaxID=97700 RepID=UPI001245388D|nr:uncharacterized protein LOC115988290 [Quercus lobata]
MVGVSMEVDITNEQNTCLALNDLPLPEHFSKREQFRDAGNDAAILADCLPTPESHIEMTIIDDFSVANHESTELTMEQRDGEADTRVHNPTCSQSISVTLSWISPTKTEHNLCSLHRNKVLNTSFTMAPRLGYGNLESDMY